LITSESAAALLIAIVGTYFVLAILASLQQAVRYGFRLFPYLPLLFWCYHLAYGFGSLWGVCALVVGKAPIQAIPEPWPGAGCYRASPIKKALER